MNNFQVATCMTIIQGARRVYISLNLCDSVSAVDYLENKIGNIKILSALTIVYIHDDYCM